METKGVQSSNVREVKWINCAKLVAILAVMTDHTYSLLYTDLGINMLSYFSVSFLFAEQHLHKAPYRINMAETDSLLRYNDRRIHYIGVHSKNSEKTYIYRAC